MKNNWFDNTITAGELFTLSIMAFCFVAGAALSGQAEFMQATWAIFILLVLLTIRTGIQTNKQKRKRRNENMKITVPTFVLFIILLPTLLQASYEIASAGQVILTKQRR